MNGDRSKEITIQKDRSFSPNIPSYIMLGHRHLEKEAIVASGTNRITLTVPVDLLAVILPSPLIEGVECLEVTYSRRAT